ncbi:MAG: hypothetical protein IJ817_03415 [Clostridia bacterium]|nr:hypothetical protein [Clostridia bacterium]
MKKILGFMFSIMFLLCTSIALAACGNNDVSISGIAMTNNMAFIRYGEELEDDPFDTYVYYSDGSKKRLDEFDEIELTKFNFSIKKLNQEGKYDDWDPTQDFEVGYYLIEYSYKKYTTNGYLQVDKAIYDGVTPSINFQSNLVYETALPSPTINFVYDRIDDAVFYIQEKTADGSYSDDAYSIDFADNSVCTWTPGAYQLYAVITTAHYEDIKTALKDFTVSRATKDNYSLFVYDNATEQYTKLNSTDAVDVTFDFANENLSDYITSSLSNVYICETDSNGNLLYDEYGIPVVTGSINLFSPDTQLVLENDVEVNRAQQYTAQFAFSIDDEYYTPKPLTLKINVNKYKHFLPSSVDLYVNETTGSTSTEYDGDEKRIYWPNEYEYDSNTDTYYGLYTYYKDGQEVTVRLYTISNFAQTNAGTYEVVCTVADDFAETVELAQYTDMAGSNSITIGSYEIYKKSYGVNADIKLNGFDETHYMSNGSTVLLRGNTYSFTAENVEAIHSGNVDSTVNPELSSIKVLNNGEVVTDGIIINNETLSLTINNDCPFSSLEIVLTFGFNNANISDSLYYMSFEVGNGVTLANVYGIVKYTNEKRTFEFRPTTAAQYEVNTYYVSADGTTYEKWDDVYGTLYVDDETDGKVLNANNVIDFSTTYYLKVEEEYKEVTLYYQALVEEHSYTNGSAPFDGYAKEVNAEDITLAIRLQSPDAFADVYDNLYIQTGYDDENNLTYEKNTSNTIDFQKTYAKQVGENMIVVYFFYKSGDEYFLATQAVDGVSEYYVSDLYCYVGSQVGSVEVYNSETETWSETSSPIAVGKYRTIFSVGIAGHERIALLDEDGNYVNTIAYEWEIVESTPVHVSLGSLTFKDESDNTLTPEPDNIIFWTGSEEDINVYMNVAVNVDSNVFYTLVFETYNVNTPGYTHLNYRDSAVDVHAFGEYVTRVYVVLEDGQYMADPSDNAIQYLEIRLMVTPDE